MPHDIKVPFEVHHPATCCAIRLATEVERDHRIRYAHVPKAQIGQPLRNYTRDMRSFSHLGGYRGRLFELSVIGDPATINGTRMSGEASHVLRSFLF